MKPVCLTIAGSDTSAGAGIQADLKTFARLGCYTATVITALTAQNTCGVHSIQPVDTSFVHKQLEAVLNDMPVSLVKIGMLPNQDILKLIADLLTPLKIPIVLDPVLISSSGAALFDLHGIDAYRQYLVPICSLLTPNRKEAALLTGTKLQSDSDLFEMGNVLLRDGAPHVLITGGDRPGIIKQDCLLSKDGENNIKTSWFKHRHIETNNSHGTGCTLSSAIAANMAKGLDIHSATEQGITFTANLLASSIDFQTGKGCGGLDHFPD